MVFGVLSAVVEHVIGYDLGIWVEEANQAPGMAEDAASRGELAIYAIRMERVEAKEIFGGIVR